MFVRNRIYRTRNGLKAKFTGKIDDDGDYHFMVDKLRVYTADGNHGGYSGIITPNPNFDIVSEDKNEKRKKDMTNYDDGKWHGWNGGECPVHPETVVQMVWQFSKGDIRPGKVNGRAKEYIWEGNDSGNIVAFRVIKEYREPREFWVNIASGAVCESDGVFFGTTFPNVIKVREVLE
jgi:hypothetical protein